MCSAGIFLCYVLLKTDSSKYVLGLREAEDRLPLKSYGWAIFLQLGCGMRCTCYVTKVGNLLLVTGACIS